MHTQEVTGVMPVWVFPSFLGEGGQGLGFLLCNKALFPSFLGEGGQGLGFLLCNKALVLGLCALLCCMLQAAW